MKKQSRGITLIALVITIIILVILAGVTITTLIGENGILTQANNAKTQAAKAELEEEVKLAVLRSYGSNGKINYDRLKTNLNNVKGVSGVPDIITEESFPIEATINGQIMQIEEDGTIEVSYDVNEWDKTACKESCFLWESDDPNAGEAYHTIIGYTTEISNEVKFKIPSRCQKIYCDNINWEDESRVFAVNNFYDVELPESLTEIGYYAFASFKFNNVNIPNSVKIIGDHAFYNSSIENVNIPDSVEKIEFGAFSYCENLQSVDIPDSVKNMEGCIFEGCTNLSKVKMPNNISKIDFWTFYNCTNLSELVIPNSLTSIGHNAFYRCINLSNITIPQSVINVDYNAFSNWTSFQTINIQGLSSAPSGWNSAWNNNCLANINWNR